MKTLFFRHRADILSEPHVQQLQRSWPDQSILVDGRCSEWRDGTRVSTRSFVRSRVAESQLRLMLWSAAHERLVKDYCPDVIVAHTTMDGLRMSRIARRLDIPLAIICHGSDVLASAEQMRQISFSGRQLTSRWPTLIRDTSMFVTVSDYVKLILERRIGSSPHPPIVRHYLGTDAWKSYSDTSRRERDLLFVGRLRPNKGPHIFVDIVKQVVASGLDVSATIVGDGSMLEHLTTYVHDQGLTEQIQFLGALPQDEVFRVMGQHRLIIVPSQQIDGGVSEGLGLASLEAQAVGTPAIVSSTGGLPETVIEGATGEIASTVQQFADLSIGLLADSDRWFLYSNSAQTHITTDFNRDLQTPKLYALLHDLVSNRS